MHTWSIRRFGSGEITVRPEKSTRFPDRLPRKRPCLPFRRWQKPRRAFLGYLQTVDTTSGLKHFIFKYEARTLSWWRKYNLESCSSNLHLSGNSRQFAVVQQCRLELKKIPLFLLVKNKHTQTKRQQWQVHSKLYQIQHCGAFTAVNI